MALGCGAFAAQVALHNRAACDAREVNDGLGVPTAFAFHEDLSHDRTAGAS